MQAGRGCVSVCLSIHPCCCPTRSERTRPEAFGDWGQQPVLPALPGAPRALSLGKRSVVGTPQPFWGVCDPKGRWEHPSLGLLGSGGLYLWGVS